MLVIYSLGLDWEHTPIDQRECFFVEEHAYSEFMHAILEFKAVNGCVLLQTCNRFELYIDAEDENALHAIAAQLGNLISYPEEKEFPALLHFVERDAHQRLMEIASGLKSQIIGEDQIITQVRAAIKQARGTNVTTPELETLFRIAVTAGKAVRTQVKMQTVPNSTAHRALELIEKELGSLAGKRALVIGNGMIGRLAAELLVEKGCSVTITLRTYRHGETLVPAGCETKPYGERFEAMNEMDVLISATRSPHFTLTKNEFTSVTHKPRIIVDMAIPRDIDPACGDFKGVQLIDMDKLRDEKSESAFDRTQAFEIIEKHLEDFEKWNQGRMRYLASLPKIAIFAGTTEGRELCQSLERAHMPATVFVATEYGTTVLPDFKNIVVKAGRLDAAQMKEVLAGFDTVVDATHPYAVEVSKNISEASKNVEARYIRLVRPATEIDDSIIVVESAQAAADYLADTEGDILLTTGTKDLPLYTKIPQFSERIFPRILPDPEGLARCFELGYKPSHTIGMQGPFSYEMNTALLRSIKASWLVTKDSGISGGVMEKLAAAEATGARVLMIARPQEPVAGYTLAEVRSLLIPKEKAESAQRPLRFPLFVDLVGAKCVIVGAGTIGMRRCKVLKEFGADITLVSRSLLEQPEGITIVQRDFMRGDTEGATLVVAATNDREVNRAVYEECVRNGVPVSVADSVEESTFFFPAICKTHNLSAGLVSNGEDHSLVSRTAKAVRKTMKELDA